MNVSSLVRKTITTCTSHDTLERAAQLMWERDIGCLPVIDDQGHVVGMVTDRDVCMAAYTQGTPLRAIPVATAMSRRVFSCTEHDDLKTVERVMSQHQIRRMPVIDSQGHPVGILSLNDIVRAASAGKLPPAEVTSTLAAVSAPRAMTTAAS